MTFDDWFYGQYGDGSVALRAEYFYDDLEEMCDSDSYHQLMKEWLMAAFEAGQFCERTK
jgi:hypothetical protein